MTIINWICNAICVVGFIIGGAFLVLYTAAALAVINARGAMSKIGRT